MQWTNANYCTIMVSYYIANYQINEFLPVGLPSF